MKGQRMKSSRLSCGIARAVSRNGGLLSMQSSAFRHAESHRSVRVKAEDSAAGKTPSGIAALDEKQESTRIALSIA
jgi:hypothetical protein